MAREKNETFGFDVEGKSAHTRIAVAAQYARAKREPAALFECFAAAAVAMGAKSAWLRDRDLADAVRAILKAAFPGVRLSVTSAHGVRVSSRDKDERETYAMDRASVEEVLQAAGRFMRQEGREYDPYADYNDMGGVATIDGVRVYWSPARAELPSMSECMARAAKRMGADLFSGNPAALVGGFGWDWVQAGKACRYGLEESSGGYLLVRPGSDYTAAAGVAAAFGLARVCVPLDPRTVTGRGCWPMDTVWKAPAAAQVEELAAA